MRDPKLSTWRSCVFGKHPSFANLWLGCRKLLRRWVYRIYQRQPKISEIEPLYIPVSIARSILEVSPLDFQEQTLPIYSGIGVGVYQGTHVLLHQLEKSYFDQNWVIEPLRSYNHSHITKYMAFQLFQLGALLLYLHYSDLAKMDLRALNEIELLNSCPHSKLSNMHETVSQVSCETEECPMQELRKRLSGQSQLLKGLLCPISPLLH